MKTEFMFDEHDCRIRLRCELEFTVHRGYPGARNAYGWIQPEPDQPEIRSVRVLEGCFTDTEPSRPMRLDKLACEAFAEWVVRRIERNPDEALAACLDAMDTT